jgi:hypothetical protein
MFHSATVYADDRASNLTAFPGCGDLLQVIVLLVAGLVVGDIGVEAVQ